MILHLLFNRKTQRTYKTAVLKLKTPLCIGARPNALFLAGRDRRVNVFLGADQMGAGKMPHRLAESRAGGKPPSLFGSLSLPRRLWQEPCVPSCGSDKNPFILPDLPCFLERSILRGGLNSDACTGA